MSIEIGFAFTGNTALNIILKRIQNKESYGVLVFRMRGVLTLMHFWFTGRLAYNRGGL